MSNYHVIVTMYRKSYPWGKVPVVRRHYFNVKNILLAVARARRNNPGFDVYYVFARESHNGRYAYKRACSMLKERRKR